MEFEEYLFERMKSCSCTVLDEKLGWVFYPSQNAIEEGLNRSMA